MAPDDLRDLLHQPVEEVAPSLLGMVVRRGEVAVRLTEVEAYGGADDAASHAWKGERPRNRSMFLDGGHAYVYLSHGLHLCLNVVTGTPGAASAVLLRAGAVVAGEEQVALRRSGVSRRDWTRGPGRLAAALGVERTDDGADLLDPTSPLTLEAGDTPGPRTVVAGPRVGISREHDRPWRFVLAGEPSVSAYRSGAPVRRTRR